MNIEQIDKNFALTTINEPDIEWISAHDERFTLCGVYHDGEKYIRLPEQIAKDTNEGVAHLYEHTSGGRLRFKTNSPFVAVKAVISRPAVMRNMPLTGSASFAIYMDGIYKNTVIADYAQFSKIEGESSAIQGICKHGDASEHAYEIYFPLYNGVREVYIGVRKNSEISKYDYKKCGRVVYYGSSITQGGCASRPGNDYVGHLSRMLDTDYLNLGFSGSARGERAMVDYIASLEDVSVFVLDYDHNAPNAAHLQNTHYPLYSAVRSAHSDIPIVLISRPDFCHLPDHIARREVILDTYNRALANGDKNIYFIDGETLFEGDMRDACTCDGCHPNDLGFYRMAKVIYPVLKSLV